MNINISPVNIIKYQTTGIKTNSTSLKSSIDATPPYGQAISYCNINFGKRGYIPKVENESSKIILEAIQKKITALKNVTRKANITEGRTKSESIELSDYIVNIGMEVKKDNTGYTHFICNMQFKNKTTNKSTPAHIEFYKDKILSYNLTYDKTHKVEYIRNKCCTLSLKTPDYNSEIKFPVSLSKQTAENNTIKTIFQEMVGDTSELFIKLADRNACFV